MRALKRRAGDDDDYYFRAFPPVPVFFAAGLGLAGLGLALKGALDNGRLCSPPPRPLPRLFPLTPFA